MLKFLNQIMAQPKLVGEVKEYHESSFNEKYIIVLETVLM